MKISTPSPSCVPWLIGGGGGQVITAGEKDTVFAESFDFNKKHKMLESLEGS